MSKRKSTGCDYNRKPTPTPPVICVSDPDMTMHDQKPDQVIAHEAAIEESNEAMASQFDSMRATLSDSSGLSQGSDESAASGSLRTQMAEKFMEISLYKASLSPKRRSASFCHADEDQDEFMGPMPSRNKRYSRRDVIMRRRSVPVIHSPFPSPCHTPIPTPNNTPSVSPRRSGIANEAEDEQVLEGALAKLGL